jgi:hypothetical protein
MEMHLVHYKNTYKSFAEAANYPDGLAVLALFIDAKPFNNYAPLFEVTKHKSNKTQMGFHQNQHLELDFTSLE